MITKNNKFQIAGVFLIGLFFLFSCKSFGDPIVGASGTVKDTGGNPLAGVTVVIETKSANSRQSITAQDGLFDVSLIGADAAQTKISFAKAGYRTVEKDFDSEGRKTFDVTLEPEFK